MTNFSELTSSLDLNARRQTDKKNAPGSRGRSLTLQPLAGGRSGGLLLDQPGLAAADLDLARLHRLRHLVDKVDMQHAVVEAGADDLDMVGEAEAALESPPGDAAVQ